MVVNSRKQYLFSQDCSDYKKIEKEIRFKESDVFDFFLRYTHLIYFIFYNNKNSQLRCIELFFFRLHLRTLEYI